VRYVVYGAGAIGGVVGARLFRAKLPVVLIARGAHLGAIRRGGLVLRSPEGSESLAVPAAGAPSEIAFHGDDVVLLATKTQDAASALDALREAAGAAVPVVCLQNGLESARLALRRFERVLGALLVLPTSHLEPGVVLAHSAPVPGVVDLGRFPSGADALAEEVASDLRRAGFASEVRAEIQPWQWAKLLTNLLNALHAACGSGADFGELPAALRAEGEACLRAAGIPFVGAAEFGARSRGVVRLVPIEGEARGGGSSWQSLARGTGSIEADYLNGEIALLGRLHGVATPRNAALQALAARLARERRPPASLSVIELRAALALPASAPLARGAEPRA
jgi:2-dehydropantoate 2-reductase